MRPRLLQSGCWIALALTAALAAAQPQSVESTLPDAGSAALLNSERIEARFGSYGIEVLASDGRLRLSNLYSTDGPGGRRTTRTLALVEYRADVPAALAAEHAAILAGGSIGATFKAAGYDVLKTPIYFGAREPGPALVALMRLDTPAPLAVHVYRLDVARDGDRLPYVRILEVHHPDYLTPAAVRSIYAPGWRDADNADVGSLLTELDARGY